MITTDCSRGTSCGEKGGHCQECGSLFLVAVSGRSLLGSQWKMRECSEGNWTGQWQLRRARRGRPGPPGPCTACFFLFPSSPVSRSVVFIAFLQWTGRWRTHSNLPVRQGGNRASVGPILRGITACSVLAGGHRGLAWPCIACPCMGLSHPASLVVFGRVWVTCRRQHRKTV